MARRKTRSNINTTTTVEDSDGPQAAQDQVAVRSSTGYSTPSSNNSGIFYERRPPTHNDRQDSWLKFHEEFRLFIRETLGNRDIIKGTFSDEENIQIYGYLVKVALDPEWNIILLT